VKIGFVGFEISCLFKPFHKITSIRDGKSSLSREKPSLNLFGVAGAVSR
jgi:hypothetical protein